jgi:excisionase family DNA binding protein
VDPSAVDSSARLPASAIGTSKEPEEVTVDAPASSPVLDAVDEPTVLTVDELARLLRVDRKTIYELVRRGELPGVRRLGRSVRIHRATVLAWLSEGQGRVSRSRRIR